MKKVEDRLVQYPNRYELKDVNTGKVLGVFDLTEVLGTVQKEGTEINAELFDSIDTDIKDKVAKVEGKGLSTNDYDNTEKKSVANSARDRHIHTNKATLDTYDQSNADIKDAIGKKHSHVNKSVLDSIEEAFTTALKTALESNSTARHTHSNKATLDKVTEAFTTALKASIEDNASKAHTHSNKGVLDATTASFTTELKKKLDSTPTSFIGLGETSTTAYPGDKGKKNRDDINKIEYKLGNTYKEFNFATGNKNDFYLGSFAMDGYSSLTYHVEYSYTFTMSCDIVVVIANNGKIIDINTVNDDDNFAQYLYYKYEGSSLYIYMKAPQSYAFISGKIMGRGISNYGNLNIEVTIPSDAERIPRGSISGYVKHGDLSPYARKTEVCPKKVDKVNNINDVANDTFYIPVASGGKAQGFPYDNFNGSILQVCYDVYYKKQIALPNGNDIYYRYYDGWTQPHWKEWRKLSQDSDISAINTRLDNLGFKSGSISGVSGATLTKQAKYAMIKNVSITTIQGQVQKFKMSDGFIAKTKTTFNSGEIYGAYQTRANWSIYVEGNYLCVSCGSVAGAPGASVNATIMSGGFEIQ